MFTLGNTLVLLSSLFGASGSKEAAPLPEAPQEPRTDSYTSTDVTASSGAIVSARASVRILRPVGVKDGKSDVAHTRSRVKVQSADGTWQEIEVLDFP